MARKAENAPGPANQNAAPPDNSEAMKKQIADGISDMDKLDIDIEAAVEKHVAPLRKRRRKISRDLKTETGISSEILEAQRRIFKIARKASELEDEDHRDKVFDDMKTAHNALHPGRTVDFVKVIERANAA